MIEKAADNLVILKGDWEQMGEAFGATLKDQALIKYFMSSPDRFATHACKHMREGVSVAASWALRNLCLLPGSLRVRREDRRFLRGLARVLSLPEREVVSSFAAPDLFSMLVYLGCVLKGKGVPHVLPACSSFVLLPETSADGTLYHGRNLDFDGGRLWSNKQRLVVIEPAKGVPFLMVTGEGLYTPGVTSINREGISVSVNMLFVRGWGLFKLPLLTVLSKVISQARSLAEAERILKGCRTFAGWGITVADAQRGEAALFEASPHGVFRVDPEEGILCYTNTCLSEELQEFDYAPSSTWAEHNHTRLLRLRGLLEEKREKLNAHTCLSILSDSYDLSSQHRQVLGNAVAMAGNVLSVLFNFQNDLVWVSQGEVPANCMGVYHAYSLSALFRGEVEVVERFAPHQLRLRSKGLRLFMESMQAWEKRLDLKTATERMTQAVEACSDEPLFRFVLALLLAKSHEFSEALAELEIVDRLPLSPLRKAHVCFWKGRVSDLLGRRREAVRFYQQTVAISRYRDIIDAAWRGIRRPYTVKELARLELFFLVADWLD